MHPHTAFVLSLKSRRPFTPEVIAAHVAHLRALDEEGALVVAGPLVGGRGGLVIIRAQDAAAAERIAAADPFVAEGFSEVGVSAMLVASRENDFLLEPKR